VIIAGAPSRTNVVYLYGMPHVSGAGCVGGWTGQLTATAISLLTDGDFVSKPLESAPIIKLPPQP
jgi:hypothetical protein